MTRCCDLTGKRVQKGNKVSHAKNRTRRAFVPNLLEKSMYSFVLDKWFSLRVAVSTVRTVTFKGGLDNFLLKTKRGNMTPAAQKIRSEIISKVGFQKHGVAFIPGEGIVVLEGESTKKATVVA